MDDEFCSHARALLEPARQVLLAERQVQRLARELLEVRRHLLRSGSCCMDCCACCVRLNRLTILSIAFCCSCMACCRFCCWRFCDGVLHVLLAVPARTSSPATSPASAATPWSRPSLWRGPPPTSASPSACRASSSWRSDSSFIFSRPRPTSRRVSSLRSALLLHQVLRSCGPSLPSAVLSGSACSRLAVRSSRSSMSSVLSSSFSSAWRMSSGLIFSIGLAQLFHVLLELGRS